jgi:hypothetical protein
MVLPPSTTTTTTTGGGGMPDTCTTANLTFNEPACSSCAESSCCDPLQICDASMGCLDYLGCIQACSDQDCVDTCGTTHAQGKTELDALDSCLDTSCSDECGGNQNFPICDSGLSVPEEACATCLGTTCCEDVKACEAEASCMGCVTGSATDCDASTLDEAVRDCWDVDCMAECGEAGF